MKARVAIAVAVASLVSAGVLLAQQTPTKAPAKPAATQPAAPAPVAQAKPSTQAQQPQAKPAPAAPKWTTDQIKEAQEGLKRAKVYSGPVNGMLGAATRRAIRAFQKEHKLAENGELSDSLLTMLKAVP